jgi:hypothetical protein
MLTISFSIVGLDNAEQILLSVNNQEIYGQQNIVQACFQQHCYRLGVFCSVVTSYTGSIRDDSSWISRKNSLELIELSSINKVSLV